MGLIAHPEKITGKWFICNKKIYIGISSTNDGKWFFTSGYDDYAVNIWSVNTGALEKIFSCKFT